MTLLSIRNLAIALPIGADRLYAAKNINFDLAAGEILCIVGESGSGKSMSANAIMGLLPQGVEPVEGTITFDGREILGLSEKEMLKLRGSRISMIFQEPLSALNPLMRVGAQIAEVFEAHGVLKGPETARTRSGAAGRSWYSRAPIRNPRLPLSAVGRAAPARDDRDGASAGA